MIEDDEKKSNWNINKAKYTQKKVDVIILFCA